jgi:hypothetical protein
LLTPQADFLTHFPSRPQGFAPTNDGFFAHAPQFPVNLEATFEALGPPAVIAIGQPANTASKTSTPWEIVLMHEHFHQLQYAQPGYFEAVNALGLSHGEKTAMWMLTYPFPYAKPAVVKSFDALRDQLLLTLAAPAGSTFNKEAKRYLRMRRKFMAQLSPDDHKYLSFQLWQEGVARYTQMEAAEAAANYHPTPAYEHLPDYESFASYAPKLRASTLEQLRTIDIAQAGRDAIYPFGGCEAMLLDRINPAWKSEYFHHLLSTDSLFVLNTR